MMVVDFDDFGANHIISEQCQSHDCRDMLDKLHYANGSFKVTLFAIPAEMTYELAEWCKANSSWVELAVHGIGHNSNYECDKMTYEEFDNAIQPLLGMIEDYFVKGFKAPGWQISDDIYKWLDNHGWWVADQSYNNKRRPLMLPAYINDNGSFYTLVSTDKDKLDDKGQLLLPSKWKSTKKSVDAWHGHVWDVGSVGSEPNGIYESYEQVETLVKAADNFQFVSEVVT